MIYRTAAVLAIASSTAAVTLAQLNLPKDFWVGKPLFLYASVLIISMAALTQLSRYTRSAQAIRTYERDVRAILSSGLNEISIANKVDFDEVGIHFFRVGGVLFKRLVNVGALRLRPNPYMIDPRWKKGMGVAGKSWKVNDFLAVDWEDFYATCEKLGSKDFKKRSKDDRYALSWGMFQLTRGYLRIAASPIRDRNGSVIGCVVVDTPASLSLMDSSDTRQVLHDMAIAVAALGRPPIGWTDGRLH